MQEPDLENPYLTRGCLTQLWIQDSQKGLAHSQRGE